MEDESGEPKARKACINCRRQKMKCRIDSGSTCRRCERAGLPCIFVPRANASAFMVPASMPLAEMASYDVTRDILRRVKVIEEHLGLPVTGRVLDEAEVKPAPTPSTTQDAPVLLPDMSASGSHLQHLWDAVAKLERCTAGPRDAAIWDRNTIQYLWQTFHDKMPGLHFLPGRQIFSSPEPLLLASMLYCSSIRGSSATHAALAPGYFRVLSCAISQLSIPGSELAVPFDSAARSEPVAFHSVLGLVLASLLSEARVRETGLWISVAYNLMLEHCPPQVDEGSFDWPRMFKGVQIVDLEHASLHLTCPVVPVEPPFAALQIPHHDPLYRLSRMMHTGLSRFSGRGLPTIWSCFAGAGGGGLAPPSSSSSSSSIPFTPIDAAVIRDWARSLDDWLVEFARTGDETDQQRTLVFRQYVLHRLVVLSIYHPARGCNLQSNSITLHEQHELLVSARATLKLHVNDKSIWSNWDLIMITWAALIVLQGEMRPSLRETLAARLEQQLDSLHTPSPSSAAAAAQQAPLDMAQALDYSWQLFDNAIIEQVMDPFWIRPQSNLPPMPH
ncbi:Zn(2)-C6 fungal-type DNA-binding domain protein [Cordyceps fumosorosea ARSEF 2679]|uniref:Zn(2)-C6 fungal-type DNA-binding domain protein n=1 Tax=Cordyceps fumosorosea (strain ARSEF 2679) TaxID=1081104 RepID=A0A162MAF5_CORFA|nr:Zn(2)-C6 fungal-type DNA-binding domain protein [Cordyceps fumosorosea ARSEF 2679]OAA53350.1 Zn(2)-C6 fungal-type DNA-binding domain protein [Cordyceps fumosorosea ARSEF 2679]